MSSEQSAKPSPTWVDTITATRPILGQHLDIPIDSWVNVLKQHVSQYPNDLLYVTCDDVHYTVRDFYDLSLRVAKSLIALGLHPFDGVSIHGFNAVPWFAADVGASLAACIPAGIYTTNKADIVAYILNHSRSRVIFVDDDVKALLKILSVVDQASSLLKVVVWGDKFDRTRISAHPYADNVITWDEFLMLGEAVANDEVEKRHKEVKPESACKLIYTSGTTGPPKAVIISQDNVQFTARHFGRVVGAGDSNDERLVSYLPCSHIAANTIDITGAVMNRCVLYLADSNALRGTLVKTLRKARPTVVIAVPRVFEKMQEGMLKAGANNGLLKRVLATWAKDVGRRASAARDAGEDVLPWGYQLADMLVFSNVRKALGLDAARIIINTSAPMQKATDLYFKNFDFRIIDLYGMSEATGPFTLNYPDYKPGSSGKALPGIEVKLVKKISDNEGELCFRGRNMFMGYLDNPSESAATMDADGYVHSGDVGKIDSDGFITITGRAKELLITAGGENVAPVLVESTLLCAMPAIARAFAIGDKRKFVSAMLIPFMDEEGKLIGPAAQVNPETKTAVDIENDETWQEYLRVGVGKANEEAISNAAKVKKFKVLSNDFSVETDELTPSLKVKRKVVNAKYADIIESMYV